MLISRDYNLDDLRKLIVRTGRISNPKHTYMFWGHIWIKEDREEPLEDRELIHKGIHMVQEEEVNVLTMLLFFFASLLLNIPIYIFILGILWISFFWFTALFYLLEMISVLGFGYKNNALEREALENQDDPDYMRKRNMFSWVKYFFKTPNERSTREGL